MPALHSCAQSQKVIPAVGKRSETGIIADPMIPNACLMPCICRTFTNASSVVILIVGSSLHSGQTPSQPSLSRSSSTILLAFSPIMIAGALVLPDTISGMIEAVGDPEPADIPDPQPFVNDRIIPLAHPAGSRSDERS